jgi:hypothetical protein
VYDDVVAVTRSRSVLHADVAGITASIDVIRATRGGGSPGDADLFGRIEDFAVRTWALGGGRGEGV